MDGSDWQQYVTRCFPCHVKGVSPMRSRSFFNSHGALEEAYQHPLGTPRAINARNQNDLRHADALLVNLLGATSVSIDTVGEMAIAHQLQIPIIAAMEPYGNLHDHPMLNEWIDCRVFSIREAIENTIAFVCKTEDEIWDNVNSVDILMEANRLPKLIGDSPIPLFASSEL
jgi:hypothetical protein